MCHTQIGTGTLVWRHTHLPVLHSVAFSPSSGVCATGTNGGVLIWKMRGEVAATAERVAAAVLRTHGFWGRCLNPLHSLPSSMASRLPAVPSLRRVYSMLLSHRYPINLCAVPLPSPQQELTPREPQKLPPPEYERYGAHADSSVSLSVVLCAETVSEAMESMDPYDTFDTARSMESYADTYAPTYAPSLKSDCTEDSIDILDALRRNLEAQEDIESNSINIEQVWMQKSLCSGLAIYCRNPCALGLLSIARCASEAHVLVCAGAE